ncbi:hypothetical protein ONZ45_g18285 [Pleurotus djamor]|nr:hypothetical protein ONZ45_g18285 [Pleurotus djamor]
MQWEDNDSYFLTLFSDSDSITTTELITLSPSFAPFDDFLQYDVPMDLALSPAAQNTAVPPSSAPTQSQDREETAPPAEHGGRRVE